VRVNRLSLNQTIDVDGLGLPNPVDPGNGLFLDERVPVGRVDNHVVESLEIETSATSVDLDDHEVIIRLVVQKRLPLHHWNTTMDDADLEPLRFQLLLEVSDFGAEVCEDDTVRRLLGKLNGPVQTVVVEKFLVPVFLCVLVLFATVELGHHALQDSRLAHFELLDQLEIDVVFDEVVDLVLRFAHHHLHCFVLDFGEFDAGALLGP